MNAPQTPSELLGTFVGLDWTAHDVQVWRGSRWPDGALVKAACCVLYVGDDQLVLAKVATRGWDVPGGRIDPDEDVCGGLGRELLEEVGVEGPEYSEPELLGWLLILDHEQPFLILYFKADLLTRRLLSTEVPDEILDVRVFSIDLLPDEVVARAWYPLIK